MLVKVLCVFVIVGVCSASVEENTPEGPAPFYELPCTSIGGICLQSNECPEGKQAAKGYCPLQQKQGVECCYSVAKSAKTCKAKGGECMPSSWGCPDFLRITATDCDYGENCCVVVHK